MGTVNNEEEGVIKTTRMRTATDTASKGIDKWENISSTGGEYSNHEEEKVLTTMDALLRTFATISTS